MNYKYKIIGRIFCTILAFALLTFITGCANYRNMKNNKTGQTGEAQGLTQTDQFGMTRDNQRLADGNQPDQARDNLRMGEVGQTNQAGDTGYKIGDAIKINDTQLTVNEVTKSGGGEFDKPKSGNEYVVIRVTVENTGNSTISYNPYNFKVQNSQGQITDPAFTMIDQDTALQSGELAPGGKVSGTVTFEQPINDPELKLQYTPDLFGQNVTVVNLQ